VQILLRPALACALLAACNVSPQPDPPNFDVDRIEYTEDMLRGEPGAVLAPAGQISILAFTGMDDPVLAPVQPDGSFGPVAWAPALDSRTRLRQVGAGDPGAPVDIVRAGDRAAAVEPLSPCVELPLVLDLGAEMMGFEEIRPVPVTNNCPEPDEIMVADDTRIRQGTEGFMLLPSMPPVPFGVPPGLTRTLPVRFSPVGPGPAEDLLFVDLITSAGRQVRAVTLVGEGL
jgi:hypothetical protein